MTARNCDKKLCFLQLGQYFGVSSTVKGCDKQMIKLEVGFGIGRGVGAGGLWW